jgi:2-phospho-L-lactate/phosphoenolpyruvate guanylyltransferase
MRGSPVHDNISDGSDTGVVVPVRAFSAAKARLATRLDAPARAALAQRLAETVVRAAQPYPLVIVSSAPEVRAWAASRSIRCLDDPGTLDGAAYAGRDWAVDAGLGRVVVAHADLPFATSLAPVAEGGAESVARLVPCHRNDGTPVLSVPVAAPFRFQYGPGSFQRHVDEARRCDLEVCVVRDPDLAFDVDVPEDLDAMVLRT